MDIVEGLHLVYNEDLARFSSLVYYHVLDMLNLSQDCGVVTLHDLTLQGRHLRGRTP